MKFFKYNPYVLIFLLLVFLGCSKKEASETPKETENTIQAFKKSVADAQFAARPTPPETQALIQKYAEWAFSRDYSLNPFNDETGAKQYAAQPFTNGTMFLAAGMAPEIQTRNITISYSQYQKVFFIIVGFINWSNDCPPNSLLPNDKFPFGIFNSNSVAGLNMQNTSISLNWNGNSILPIQIADLRFNSGLFNLNVHPTWPGGCSNPSLAFSDGFFTTVPLTLGTHRLELAGSSYRPVFKSVFSNHIVYNITVVP